MAESDSSCGVRLDKWLFIARIFRNRQLAHRACELGRVTVNHQTAKPHRNLQVGDRIEAQVQPDWTRVVIVKQLVDRPVPKAQVSTLFEDLSSPRPAPDPWKRLLSRPPVLREKGAGRPTKRERRALAALRRQP